MFLKHYIFPLFGVNAKVKDTYKDAYGKGINERYQEAIGETYDDELQDLIDLFLDRTIIAETMLSRMIPYMEYNLGNPVVVLDSVSMRRKILKFAQHIYNIKSTQKSYEVLLKLLGFNTVIVEEFADNEGFDSDLTLDDDFRTFDGSNKACNFYSVHLTGGVAITQTVYDAIIRIIEYLEPINADLREITYNGSSLVLSRIFDYTFESTFE